MEFSGGIDRRAALAGLAAATAGGAEAQSLSPSAFARSPLAANPLAQRFQPAPRGMLLPDVPLEAHDGERRFSGYRGRTLLVSLWAEWCAPCLVEMPDFAALQQRHGNRRFEILPVLTGSRRRLDPNGAARLMARLDARAFEPVVEEASGDRLLKSLTFGGAGGARPSLPCNLLVDSRGRICARQFGAMTLPLLRRTRAETGRDAASLWASEHGHQFVAALAAGLIDRL